ncbi:hypothetical protein PJK55_13610 [Exiguobacterium sp. MMG028]|uniref:hypothetical protein n=1 Tax=Exiguobacterium sp. MMG028 TaxID=3021979 RepID=UPI0022FEBEB2|nr:hypothetical protein [Exiguobacterium sp. MMG028]MDA5561772.1 hypothetical protein [Exiguobacterium sp. MMG028]
MSHEKRLDKLSRSHVHAIHLSFIFSVIFIMSGLLVWWLGWFTAVQTLFGSVLLAPLLLMLPMWKRTQTLLRFNEDITYRRTVWLEVICALIVVLLNIGIAIAIIVTEIYSFTIISFLLMFVASMISRHVDQRMKQLDPEHVTYSDMARYKTKRS